MHYCGGAVLARTHAVVKWPCCRATECAQGKLKSDALKRMESPLLSVEDYRAMFDEHVANALATARKQYLAALVDVVQPAMFADGELKPKAEAGEVAKDFEAASEALAAHACWQKLPPSERRATWRNFVRDLAAGLPNPGAPRAPAAGAAGAAASALPPGARPPPPGAPLGRPREPPRPSAADAPPARAPPSIGRDGVRGQPALAHDSVRGGPPRGREQDADRGVRRRDERPREEDGVRRREHRDDCARDHKRPRR